MAERSAPVIVALILVVLVLITSGSSYYTYYLNISLIFAIIAYSQWLVLSVAGQPAVGQAAFMAVGAYTTGYLDLSHGLNIILSVVCGCVAAGISALPLGLISRRLGHFYLGMVALAIALLIQRIATIWQNVTGGPAGLAGVHAIAVDERTDLAIVAVILFIVATGLWLVLRTSVGRGLFAIRDNEIAAAATGIPVHRYKLLVVVASATIAGLSGGLYVQYVGFISPDTFSIHASLQVVICVLIGGTGYFAGPLVGSLVIEGLLTIVLSRFVDYQSLILGMLLFTSLIVLRQGLVGTLVDLCRQAFALIGRESSSEGAAEIQPDLSAITTAHGDAQRRSRDLKIVGLSRKFGGITALADISLQFDPGTIYGILGPNGSGKTTFVNVVTGQYKPDSGNVYFGGRNITGWRPERIARAGISRTFQNLGLFSSRTAIDNVLTGLDRVGTGRWHRIHATRVGAVRGLLAALGVRERTTEPVRELPYGVQKRVEIARAMSTSPGVLCLDEPAAGLNAVEAIALIPLIRTIAATGAIVIVIDHNVDFIADVSDVVIAMEEGRVICEGTPAEVVRDPQVIASYLGNEAVSLGESVSIGSRSSDPAVNVLGDALANKSVTR
jgi:ABC-type branched-subunit amino acid transport system ATPase component/ABC-type branched-subunit amino acid transport system permease subunit